MTLSSLRDHNNYNLFVNNFTVDDTLTATNFNVSNEHITNLWVANIFTDNPNDLLIQPASGQHVQINSDIFVQAGKFLTVPTANITTDNVTTLNVTNPKTDYQMWIGPTLINQNLAIGSPANTYGLTYAAASTYYYGTTSAITTETDIFYVPITNMLRSAANKGFQLTSISILYEVNTGAITSLSLQLYRNTLSNGTTMTVTSIPLTQPTYPLTVNSPNLYYQTATVTTPAYQGSNNIYNIEISIGLSNATTSRPRIYGLMLGFSANWY